LAIEVSVSRVTLVELFAFPTESDDWSTQEGAVVLPLVFRICPDVPLDRNDVVSVAD
jgi:hypothetical protein